MGEHGFYDDVFPSLGVPYEAVKWRQDVNPIDRDEAMLHKQMQVATLIRVHRVRGHLIADLDPLRWKQPKMPAELDPATYGLTIWDLDREFLTGGVAGVEKMRSATCSACCATPTAAPSASSTCTSRTPTSSAGSRARSRACAPRCTKDEQAPHPRAPQRRRGVREVPRHQVRRHQALRSRRRGVGDPHPRQRAVDRRRRRPRRGPCSAWPTAAASTCSPTSWARATTQIFGEFEGHVDPTTVQGSGDVKYHLGATGKYESRRRRTTSASSSPPTPATWRPSTRSCSAWCAPARTRSSRPARTRAAAPDPRRRRLRRPGRGGRVPGDERHQRLPRRRHDPPDHQQPDRLHHLARVRPLLARTAPTWPRRSRRRSSTSTATIPRPACASPSWRSTTASVPQGRRDRHGVLPPPRPQRGRRPELHPAADVQGDRRAAQRAQALRRGPRQARRPHRRGGRGRARRLPASCRSPSTRPARHAPAR